MTTKTINGKGTLWATITCGIAFFINFGASSMYNPNVPRFMSELNVTATQVSFGPVLAAVCSIIFSAVAIKLMKAITPKWTLALASVLAIVSGVLHFATANIFMLYLGSIVNGAVIALGTNAVVSSILETIHGKGFVSVLGVILGVGSFGTAASTAFVAAMQSTLGWRYAYLFFLCGGGVLCLAFNLLFLPGKKLGKKEAAQENETVAEQKVEAGLTRAEAVKTPSFALMMVATVLNGTLYGSFSTFASSYWQSHGVAEATATLWLTLITTVGAILTLASGVIVAKLGTKVYLSISYICFAIGVAITIIWGSHPVAWLALLGIAFVSLIRMTNGMVAMVLPAVFGRKDYGNINMALMPTNYLGGMAGALLAGVLYDLTGTFVTTFVVGIVFAITTLVLLTLAMKITPYKANKN